jgi:hypothetical protein
MVKLLPKTLCFQTQPDFVTNRRERKQLHVLARGELNNFVNDQRLIGGFGHFATADVECINQDGRRSKLTVAMGISYRKKLIM